MTIKTNESIKKLKLDHIITKKLALLAIVCIEFPFKHA
jgi:hypothetical protein